MEAVVVGGGVAGVWEDDDDDVGVVEVVSVVNVPIENPLTRESPIKKAVRDKRHKISSAK